ncbi:hypothetical protein B4V02_13845 [Paenibacillus kribbensis]|uniref:Uncharacterized protein n=1 Tax=Paenibacillus kribbensis TaxID=172713 RepID=A0A222WME9_9BACL|nr:hypothetical protein [Paenibacillus kribbensis]ASR47680.1 hypothetical protein B4V02_13845 [Paenibacillus kribbensis]
MELSMEETELKNILQKTDRNNFALAKTQEDIANDLNITTQQLRNYKKLFTLIPELQDMVEDQDLKAITATS